MHDVLWKGSRLTLALGWLASPAACESPAADSGNTVQADAASGSPDKGAADSGSDPDAAHSAEPAPPRIIGVGAFGLRARSNDGSSWRYCGSPETGDEHTPELLRAVAYGDGVFVAVGGDANGRVMRSVNGEHWDEDVHPRDACPNEDYPSSCRNWMGAVAYLEGTWLAGGGNGATMRSEDAGRSWKGLHTGFPERHIRHLGSGAGRFIAATDGGGLYVTSDRGDSWRAASTTLPVPANSSLRVVFGQNLFLAYSEDGDACLLSRDLGENWQPCAAAAQGGTSYLFDGRRWLAALSDGYATSTNGLSWSKQQAPVMPRRLLFDGSRYFGRTDGTIYRASSPDAFEVAATQLPDFRAWTSGQVLAENLTVASPLACVDGR